MNDLKTISKLVKHILETEPQTRSNDGFLYLKVLRVAADRKGISVDGMTVENFLLNRHEIGLPGFETVRRTRQKVQQEHPELAASERVKAFRTANEAEFRAFALGDDLCG